MSFLSDLFFGPEGSAVGGTPPPVPHGIVGGDRLDSRYRVGGGQYGRQGFSGLQDFATGSAPDESGILSRFLDLFEKGSQRRLGTFEDSLAAGASGGRRGARESDIGALRERVGMDDAMSRQGLRQAFNSAQVQRGLDRAGQQEGILGRLTGLASQSQSVPQTNANLFTKEYGKYLDATNRDTGQDWRQMASRDFSGG